MLLIKIPSRIHITLIAMHNCDIRKNGGIGFSIDDEDSFIKAKTSKKENSISNNTHIPDRKKSEILNILNNIRDMYSFEHCVEIELSKSTRFHIGLGTGTAITLACIESLFLVNKREYNQEEIVCLSRRGGTSGIGVNTYFSGGFVFDAGTKIDNKNHRPSSGVSGSFSLPTLICSRDMPDWKVCILHPANISGIEGVRESDFFEKTCPIEKNESYMACYYSVFGVLASIIDSDYALFAKSINNLQKTEWKKSEIKANEGIEAKIEYLISQGADCVGLSSIGPSLYFFGNDLEKIKKDFIDRYGWHGFITRPNNSGRTLCWS
jgi:beta-ribofuranosylaminobenzene 5'-phosphate synthase